MGWSKEFAEWLDGDTVYISVAFTWDLPFVWQRAMGLSLLGYEVHAGGPAVSLMPDYLKGVARCDELSLHDVVARHNPLATFTSRGCVRRCKFCAVPLMEGSLRELRDWPVRPIVCDNNLLACSRKHFDNVTDRLKPLSGIDFNQGLDARLLTPHHAHRLSELDCTVRLSFDSVAYESSFMKAYEILRAASIPKHRIRVYVLVGFDDTPEDALYRLQTVHDLGLVPNPMRYNPLDTLERDSYVGPGWTHELLHKYVRYWSRLRYFGGIPFKDFDNKLHRPTIPY